MLSIISSWSDNQWLIPTDVSGHQGRSTAEPGQYTGWHLHDRRPRGQTGSDGPTSVTQPACRATPPRSTAAQWPAQQVSKCSGVTSWHAPSTSNNFILVQFRVNLICKLSKYCVLCQNNLHRCQQLTALSISTLVVTKLLVIKPRCTRPWSLPWPWVPHDLISSFAPPRNKSWQRHLVNELHLCSCSSC